jgi:nucleotide-binding universal stress UspA family protein
MDRLSLNQCTVPLISNRPLAGPLRRIGFPTTLSESSDDALRWAIQITKASDADLLLFHVLPPPVPLFETEAFEKPEAEKALSLLLAQVKATGVRAKASLLSGTDSIGKQIVDATTLEKIDLIVMGTRNQSKAFRLFISGSVACSVVAHAKCPVLVIPCERVNTSRPIGYRQHLGIRPLKHVD